MPRASATQWLDVIPMPATRRVVKSPETLAAISASTTVVVEPGFGLPLIALIGDGPDSDLPGSPVSTPIVRVLLIPSPTLLLFSRPITSIASASTAHDLVELFKLVKHLLSHALSLLRTLLRTPLVSTDPSAQPVAEPAGQVTTEPPVTLTPSASVRAEPLVTTRASSPRDEEGLDAVNGSALCHRCSTRVFRE